MDQYGLDPSSSHLQGAEGSLLFVESITNRKDNLQMGGLLLPPVSAGDHRLSGHKGTLNRWHAIWNQPIACVFV
jgi:hypothetical protein